MLDLLLLIRKQILSQVVLVGLDFLPVGILLLPNNGRDLYFIVVDLECAGRAGALEKLVPVLLAGEPHHARIIAPIQIDVAGALVHGNCHLQVVFLDVRRQIRQLNQAVWRLLQFFLLKHIWVGLLGLVRGERGAVGGLQLAQWNIFQLPLEMLQLVGDLLELCLFLLPVLFQNHPEPQFLTTIALHYERGYLVIGGLN